MADKFWRNAWYCAAADVEVTRQPLGRILLNEPVVFYRREDGTPVALEDVCCHRRAPLHIGTVEGDSLRCQYHGLLFDSTGRATWAQGRERISPKMRVRQYPVVSRYGWVWIWMGDPARADAAQIFDCSRAVDPNWTTVRDMFTYKGNAMIAIDNLMDLSHTAYVHHETVGSKDDLDPELVWERRENWVQGTRAACNLEPGNSLVARGARGIKIDQTKVMAYTPPYNCNVNIFNCESGVPMGEGSFNEQLYTFNIITPETDKTSFYFWATTHNFKIQDPALNERIVKHFYKLLAEDKYILEQVQSATDLAPDRPEIDLAADAGGVYARRILKRLIEAEAMTEKTVAAE